MRVTKEEIREKFIDFSIKINKLRKHLCDTKHEYNNSDQIQRSGTSIGANYCEACFAESNEDFIHKLRIARKEAYETEYWLKVLIGSELITNEQYINLNKDLEELSRILTSSINTIDAKIRDREGAPRGKGRQDAPTSGGED